MNAPDADPPCTPPRPTGNGGASHSESDGQMDSENDSDGDLQDSKKKRKYRGSREYTLMKRWVTGDKAEMDPDDIERELFELARDWMSQSKLKKLPGHQSKPTDVSLWKQFREYKAKKGSILVRLFRCPLLHRCKCKAGIRITEGPDWMQLERCGEHNANSHDDDHSKYLKHEQIVAVADAVTVAPQQSASQLRRNLQLAESPTKHIEPLLLRCMQRVVRASRAQLTVKQLQGFNIDSSFGSLAQFADVKWFKTLVARHNDPEDEFHFNIYSAFVIGRDLNAARDIVHMNITSLWFLSNILRQIATGWIFQLNADATFGFCRNAVDMIGFGVNSVGSHNHPLCWSIIPHQTEGELTYTGTFAELEEAFILSCSIRTCDRADCTSCATLKQLRAQERGVTYLASDTFKAGKIPVDSAQCDNILGFGNFTRAVFNMDPNVCKCHPLGDYSFRTQTAVV